MSRQQQLARRDVFVLEVGSVLVCSACAHRTTYTRHTVVSLLYWFKCFSQSGCEEYVHTAKKVFVLRLLLSLTSRALLESVILVFWDTL